MIGKHILNYEIKSLIGEGGMGNVYLGEHTSIGRKVAIKVLRPELSMNEDIRKRFKNEAKVMASLQHQGIVTLFDFHEDETGLYLIMEYVDGEELSDQIKRLNQPMDIDYAKSIMKQVLEAFSYAHKNGIVHRDVKPANILVANNGNVKVLDFGIAKIVGNDQFSLTKTGMQVGTAYYMSPEQVQAKEIDKRSDIYSLGITFYEMLAGYCPYKSLTSEYEIYTKIVQEPLTSLVDSMGEEYDQVWQIIKKATAKLPSERYLTCEEMLADFAPKRSNQNLKTKSLQPEIAQNQSSDQPNQKSNKLVWIQIGSVVLIVFTLIFIKSILNNNDEKEIAGDPEVEESVEETPAEMSLSASASSFLSNYKSFTFVPNNTIDGNLQTWWSPKKTGSKWLKINLGGQFPVHSIKIHAGSHYPDWFDGSDLYYKNYRIKRLRLDFSNGEFEYFDLEDVDDMQYLNFSMTRVTSYIKITPISAYEYDQYGYERVEWDDYCISEIEVLTE